jgi:hypothetical protein
MFDPKSLPSVKAASEIGHTFEPRYPFGDPIGATITVRGPESELVKRLVREQMAQLQQREALARKRGRDPEALTLEELRNQSIDLAVAYTIDWNGFIEAGAPLQPTEANLRAVYTDHSWLRRQVIDEAQELGNFVRPQPASCSSTPAPSSPST